MPDQITGTGADGTTEPVRNYLAEAADKVRGTDARIVDVDDEELRLTIEDLEADMEGDPLFEMSKALDDGFNPPPNYPNKFPLREDLILGPGGTGEPEAEIEEEDGPQTYGISFPASMLPIGATQGYWTSEPLLGLDGEVTDEPLVRVWLHAPTYKWPQPETGAPKGT